MGPHRRLRRGLTTPAGGGWLDAVRAAADGRPRAAVVASVARRAAASAGLDLAAADLPLLDAGDVAGVPDLPPGAAAPDALGAVHEALLAADERRTRGSHYTPPDLALRLVTWAVDGWWPPEGGTDGLRVHDPAVGGGAFLLAAARHQVRAGVEPLRALRGLSGVDLDPVAVSVAEAALVLWATTLGADVAAAGDALGGRLVGGDGLTTGPEDPPDLVVGNPPFLGQLRRATARDRAAAARLRQHLGPAASGYVDTAALFLLAAARTVRPGGRVVLLQPEPVLGSGHGAALRAAVDAEAALAGLWVAGERAFAADVAVCAVLLQRRSPSDGDRGAAGAPPPTVRRAVGLDVRPADLAPRPAPRSWAPLLAAARGVPEVHLAGDAGRLGDLVTTTAGFRQHFYALAPHLAEAPVDPVHRGAPSVPAGDGLRPVITTGLVDPLHLGWGERPARVAGRTWLRPGVDLAAVARDAPDVAAWVRARLVPKVVVAPQTRVVEAAVDVHGRYVPGVPLVSAEPRADLPADVQGDLVPWLVVAALSSPAATAWALAEAAGTARSPDALRLSARQVRAVPLPADRDRWVAAARALRAGRALVDIAPDLTAAHGLDPDHPVTAWWASRLPRRR